MRYRYLLVLAIVCCPVVRADEGQVLSPYDMNGDGYVNIQDIDGFIEALYDGSKYITVQDINPFVALVNAARPQLELYIPDGGVLYTDNTLPVQEGLDPEKHYIVCRSLLTYDGTTYAVATDGYIESIEHMCARMGADPATVTVIVVPATQPSN